MLTTLIAIMALGCDCMYLEDGCWVLVVNHLCNVYLWGDGKLEFFKIHF